MATTGTDTTTSQTTTNEQSTPTTAQADQAGADRSGLGEELRDPRRLLWLGGLVAVGALGVIEWPVVAAVGVGSYVAEQLAKRK